MKMEQGNSHIFVQTSEKYCFKHTSDSTYIYSYVDIKGCLSSYSDNIQIVFGAQVFQ